MGIMGVPESAVSGNASEVPDSESGATGVPAAFEFANETVPPAPIEVVEEVPPDARPLPGPA